MIRSIGLKSVGALLALLLVSCSQEGVLSEQEYHETASKAMEDKYYDVAIHHYQKLLEEYPFSDYSEESQLKIGQAQYLNKQYAESIASFQDFQRMHPTNPNLGLTEYYTAMAYLDQAGSPDRDQRAAENAQAHFQALLTRYPDSPYVEDAKKKLKECRELLAGHEYAVAKFYLIWLDPVGAEARLRRLLENYPDTDTAGDALAHFARYFRKRGDLTRSALAYASLVSQYPKNPAAAEAKEELDKLKAKQVIVPDEPLPALVETLGRPSIAVAAPTAVPAQTAASVPSPEPQAPTPARN